MFSKYAVGLYSSRPAPWREDRSAELQREIESWPAPAVTEHPEGWASIETCTVQYGRSGRRTGIAIGRLEATGERFLATTFEDDTDTLDLLDGPQPIGQRIYVRALKVGNRFTTTQERMDARRAEPADDAHRAETARRAAEFEAVL